MMKNIILIFIILKYYLVNSNSLNIDADIPVLDNIRYEPNVALVYGSYFNNVANVSVIKLGSSNSTLLHFLSLSANNSLLQVNFDDSDVYYGNIVLCTNGTCVQHEWNPLTIDTITPVPTQGGDITVSGYYLLPLEQNSSLTFTKWSVSVPSIFNNFSMIVFQYSPPIKPPQPSGINQAIEIQVRNSIIKKSYSFLGPRVYDVQVINSSLQINGESFGSDPSLITAKLDGLVLNITRLTNHFNITCSFTDNPPIYYSNLALPGIKKIVVDVNNNPTSYDLYIRPLIYDVTTVPSTTGGTVSIKGEMFSFKSGVTPGKDNFLLTIGNGSLAITNVKIVDTTLITCTIPPKPNDLTGHNLLVNVTISGAQSAEKIDSVFSYDAPILLRSQQNVDIVQITASNLILTSLVDVHFDSKISFRPNNLTKSTTNSSQTMISFDISSIPYNIPSGIYKQVFINANGVISNHIAVSLKPVITSSTHSPVQGGLITLYGRFWAEDTPQTSVKVTIGNKVCALSSPPSPSAIRCLMPSGTGSKLPVQLQLNGAIVERSDNYSFQYQNPSIVTISEITSEGGVVTLSGINFANSLNISLAEQRCDKSIYINDTTVLCEISSGKLSKLEPNTLYLANVTVDGLSGTAQLFSFTNKKNSFKLIYIIPIVIIVFTLISIGVLIYVKRRRPKRISVLQIQLNLLRPPHPADDEQFEERWYSEQLAMLIREGIPRDEATAYLKWFQENKDK